MRRRRGHSLLLAALIQCIFLSAGSCLCLTASVWGNCLPRLSAAASIEVDERQEEGGAAQRGCTFGFVERTKAAVSRKAASKKTFVWESGIRRSHVSGKKCGIWERVQRVSAGTEAGGLCLHLERQGRGRNAGLPPTASLLPWLPGKVIVPPLHHFPARVRTG